MATAAQQLPGEQSTEQRIRDVKEATRGVTEQYPREYLLKCIAEGRFPEDCWRALGEFGLLGLSIPEEHGGSGGGVLEMTALMEGLAEAGIPMLFLIVTGLARVPIVKHGTLDQIERFVQPTVSGEKKLCFAITEPNAGTNSFAMTTLATRDAEGYVLSGQKVFISGADEADWILVVARTTKVSDVEHRSEGMSLFVVDAKDPNIRMQALNIQAEAPEKQFLVFFDEVRVPAENLVGEEGRGLAGMFDSLNAERLLVAAMSLGTGDYALKKAVDYANTRAPFGKPIGSYQALQHRMALAKAELEAARLMTYSAAASFDRGESAGGQANMAKLLASRAGTQAVEAALQTHGGYAFDRDYDVVTLWPLVRLMEIAPINNEMLLNYVGQHVLGLPKSY
jgi:acyl-CoA dehydrogenase